MINNRIEEVKKTLKMLHEPCMDCEYYHGEDCYSCGGLCSRDIDATKAICQLFPQPLDDKELREQIAATLVIWYGDHNVSRRMIDRILALLQPKLEEAREKIRQQAIKRGE